MALTDWSLIAANNASADANINWREGQPAASVNNSARVMMSAIRAWQMNLAGSAVPGGTADVITISNNQPMASLSSNVVGFFAAGSNTGPVTLNVDGLGAKPLVTANSVPLAGNQIVIGNYYLAAYNAANDNWVLLGGRENPSIASYLTANDVLIGAIGEIKEWARPDLPSGGGWAWANGQALSRTTYAALWAKFGTTYGAGDGTTTFNVPDRCGRVGVGLDNMGGIAAKGRITSTTVSPNGNTLGFTGGAQTHTLDLNQMPAHSHGVNDFGHSHGTNDPGHSHLINRSAGGGGPTFTLFGGQFGVADVFAVGATTGVSVQAAISNIGIQNNGGSGAHNNVQPTIGFNYIVCHGVYNQIVPIDPGEPIGDLASNITPLLDYASQSETRAGADVDKPVKPPEVIDAIKYTLATLPTSLPAESGVLWNNGGLISIS